jgi:hypothetical protein
MAINNEGAITGYYEDSSGVARGFVRSAKGSSTSFDVPGSTGTFPGSINRDGTVTGWYTDADGNYHGFVRGK